MADQAHVVVANLVCAAIPTRRMRISTNTTDFVTIHAIRLRALIVARRAVVDVLTCGRAMAIQYPIRRVRISRIQNARGQAIFAVAVLAEAGAVAATAGRRIGGLLRGVPAEEVVAVNEVALDPLGHLDLDLRVRGVGVAVFAEILVVAGRASLGVGARRAGMLAHEVALV